MSSRDSPNTRKMARSRGATLNSAVQLLLSCLICVLVVVRARASDNNVPGGFSLTPPYFNLAEGSVITATATCGEEENGNSRTDLYCKLVGGPTLGLTGQTIQVRHARAPSCVILDPGKTGRCEELLEITAEHSGLKVIFIDYCWQTREFTSTIWKYK